MPASLLASQLAVLERPGGEERALILDATLPPEELCDASRDWLEHAPRSPSLPQ
jgi:gluconate kinase